MGATKPTHARRQGAGRRRIRAGGVPRRPCRRPPLHLAAADRARRDARAGRAPIGAFAALAGCFTPHSETLESLWWLAALRRRHAARRGVAAVRLLDGRRHAGRAALADRRRRRARCSRCARRSSLGRASGALPWSLLLVPAVPRVLLLALRRRALRRARRACRRRAALAVGGRAARGAGARRRRVPARGHARRATCIVLAVCCCCAVALPRRAVVRRRAPRPRVRLALGVLVPLAARRCSPGTSRSRP